MIDVGCSILECHGSHSTSFLKGFGHVYNHKISHGDQIFLGRSKVAIAVYKLARATNYVTCSELFVVGCSIVCIYMKEVVLAIDIVFHKYIKWPKQEEVNTNMEALNACVAYLEL